MGGAIANEARPPMWMRFSCTCLVFLTPAVRSIETAQRALANMAFNLGLTRLKSFVKMLAALEDKKYVEAAREAIDSKWAKQVHGRAQRIFELYRKAGEML